MRYAPTALNRIVNALTLPNINIAHKNPFCQHFFDKKAKNLPIFYPLETIDLSLCHEFCLQMLSFNASPPNKYTMNNNIILTQSQAAEILSISENTLNALAYSGQIPHLRMSNSSQYCFSSEALVNWFNGPTLSNNQDYSRIKKRLHNPEKNYMLKKFDQLFFWK